MTRLEGGLSKASGAPWHGQLVGALLDLGIVLASNTLQVREKAAANPAQANICKPGCASRNPCISWVLSYCRSRGKHSRDQSTDRGMMHQISNLLLTAVMHTNGLTLRTL